MNKGALFWIIVFIFALASFFIVAAVVSVKGLADLKDLLRITKNRE